MSDLSKPEPAPTPNERPALWPMVIQDLRWDVGGYGFSISLRELVIADARQRDEFGRKKYGTPLQPHNGRDALVDAYQESLDLCVYLRQAIVERSADPLVDDALVDILCDAYKAALKLALTLRREIARRDQEKV